MNTEVKEDVKALPWTQPDVLELHAMFDREFAKIKSLDDLEALFHRFFAPTGLVEEKRKEWQGKDATIEEVMTVVFELYSFRSFVYTCVFFNDFPDEVVSEWWRSPGIRSIADEDAFMEAPVKKIQQAYDKDAAASDTRLDLQKVRQEYIFPGGVIDKAFSTLNTKTPKKQVAIGAELFCLKGYIEFTLFEIEFSTTSAVWTVPEVRMVQCRFEDDLLAARSDEDVDAVEKRYLGEGGVIAAQKEMVKQKKGEAKTRHAEELTRFQDALQVFFSSQTNEELS